jgi:hypothetical protein
MSTEQNTEQNCNIPLLQYCEVHIAVLSRKVKRSEERKENKREQNKTKQEKSKKSILPFLALIFYKMNAGN